MRYISNIYRDTVLWVIILFLLPAILLSDDKKPKDYDKFLKAAKNGIHLPSDADLNKIASSSARAKEDIDWLKNKENWAGVLVRLYDNLGLFFEDLDIKVTVEPSRGLKGFTKGHNGKASIKLWLDPPGRGKPIPDLGGVVTHEMIHAYIGFPKGVPLSLNEGLAEYASGCAYKITKLSGLEIKKVGDDYPAHFVNYGRGFIFWEYVSQKFKPQAIKDYAKTTNNGSDYKDALLKATKVGWDKLVEDEYKWAKDNWRKVAEKYGVAVK